MAEDKAPRADGTLRVRYAGSGQGHIKLHKRVAPDGDEAPAKEKKKRSLLSRLTKQLTYSTTGDLCVDMPY
jgi:hypothetical protein